MLSDTIKEQIKQAMRDKDQLRLNTLRGLSAAFVNELVAQGKKPNEEISDDIAIKVLKRALKQRKEAAEQFVKGGREDLAEKENQEAQIIEEFLPEQLSEDAVNAFVEECISDTSASSMQDFSKVMPCVMQKVAGQADGAMVRALVEKKLS